VNPMDPRIKPRPEEPSLAPYIIKDAGELLYGPQWQAGIARELNISARTVRRWASGETAPSRSVSAELMRLCSERVERLLEVGNQLDEHEIRRLDFENTRA